MEEKVLDCIIEEDENSNCDEILRYNESSSSEISLSKNGKYGASGDAIMSAFR